MNNSPRSTTRAAAADGQGNRSLNSHHQSHLQVGQVKHFGVTPFGLHASGQHNDPQMLPGRPAGRGRGTPVGRWPGPARGPALEQDTPRLGPGNAQAVMLSHWNALSPSLTQSLMVCH
jgi:hypothetical protein